VWHPPNVARELHISPTSHYQREKMDHTVNLTLSVSSQFKSDSSVTSIPSRISSYSSGRTCNGSQKIKSIATPSDEYRFYFSLSSGTPLDGGTHRAFYALPGRCPVFSFLGLDAST
jgi:hypothetical protein